LSGRGIFALAVVQGGCDCLEILLQRVFASHLKRPNMHLGINKSECGTLKKDLFQYTRDILLGSVGDVFRGQMGPMVISRTSGPSDVATYSVSARVLGMTNDLANALFGGVLLTAFAQLHGSGDRTRLNREFERATRVTAGFGAWLIGGLLIFGGAFIERWLGKEFGAAYDLLAILAIPHALVIMQYPAYNLLFTIGGQRALMLVSCSGGVAAGVLSLFLVKYLGVQGVAMALAIELSIASLIAIPLLLRRFCGIRPVYYIGINLLWPALKGLCVPLVCAWLVRDQVQADYGALLYCGIVYALGLGISAPWLLLDRDGRQTMKNALAFWK
jgi:O-antigen/teichoic acid export membrane protein